MVESDGQEPAAKGWKSCIDTRHLEGQYLTRHSRQFDYLSRNRVQCRTSNVINAYLCQEKKLAILWRG